MFVHSLGLRAVLIIAFVVAAALAAPTASAGHSGLSVTIHGGGPYGGYGATFSPGHRPQPYGYVSVPYYSGHYRPNHYRPNYNQHRPHYNRYYGSRHRDPWCRHHRVYHVHRSDRYDDHRYGSGYGSHGYGYNNHRYNDNNYRDDYRGW